VLSLLGDGTHSFLPVVTGTKISEFTLSWWFSLSEDVINQDMLSIVTDEYSVTVEASGYFWPKQETLGRIKKGRKGVHDQYFEAYELEDLNNATHLITGDAMAGVYTKNGQKSRLIQSQTLEEEHQGILRELSATMSKYDKDFLMGPMKKWVFEDKKYAQTRCFKTE
jgi:hypothetical protein